MEQHIYFEDPLKGSEKWLKQLFPLLNRGLGSGEVDVPG